MLTASLPTSATSVTRNRTYAIEVMRRYGIPARTYIWKGGTYAAPDPRAGQDWCFAYGEKEWVDGKKFNKAKEDAKGDLLAVPKIQPIGRVNCSTGEPI